MTDRARVVSGGVALLFVALTGLTWMGLSAAMHGCHTAMPWDYPWMGGRAFLGGLARAAITLTRCATR